MENKTLEKGKSKNGWSLYSTAVTQVVCFIVVVSVAVLGFIQTRRAVFQIGEGVSILRQSEKSLDGNGGANEVAPPISSKHSASIVTKSSRNAQKTTTGQKTTSSHDEDVANVTRLKIVYSPVSIRSGAGEKYALIKKTTSGSVYTLLSKRRDSEGREWYQISLEDGKTGWILATCGRLLEASDDGSTVVTTKKTSAKTKASQTTVSLTQKASSTTKKTSSTTKKASSTTKKTSSTTSKATAVTSKSKTSSKTTTTTGTSKTFDLSKLKKIEISESPVNIRSGPGTKYEIVGKTEKGKVFGLISTQKGADKKTWCRIALSATSSGWILRSCCRDLEEETAPSESQDKLLLKLQPDDKSAKYFIVVYIGSQSTVVYKKDVEGNYTKQVKVFTCSTGKKSSPTRTGKYHIRAKYRWRWLVGNVYGQYNSSISSDYLFHSVPYFKQDYKTLEDEEYDKLGTPASKGCIRMCVRDCKWIYDKCDIGTQVRIVEDSGPSGPGVPERKSGSKYSGWDPSDKWAEGNPYFS